MLEVVRVEAGALDSFFGQREREALRAYYEFRVVWHEASYGFAVRDGDDVVAGGILRVAASLGHVGPLVVDAAHRRCGYGRAILDQMAKVANYYNCHKMTVMAVHPSNAERFFEACGYAVEAVLAQHTFKLDMAMLRKFLL